MSVFSGDFLGFQLGNIHSSQLNITRVSSDDRYNESLTPNFNDSTESVPGGDGTYYWDTFYSSKTFTINFAFDNLREEDIRKLKQVFSFKGVQPLIFDEYPYKKYLVKCSSSPILKYIGFDFEGMIIYKGEGTINLIAYYPYAVGTNTINIEDMNGKENINLEIECHNNGDLPAPFKMFYNTTIATVIKKIVLKDTNSILKFNFDSNDFNNTGDEFICIDTRTHLIEGLDENFQKTGHLYNYGITGGDFFNLPIGKNIIQHINSADSSVIYKYRDRNDYVKCEFNCLYY